ncbi:glycosyltransferase family 39 protein, partial [Microgenomates group bacterium]|nr:glycosyltransferase family 39 protein [Microgenomates group bacterium]
MKTKICLILIFLLAVALRFYQLGQVPSGFVNDEAAFGYNAYSLLKTGKDEFGKAWPTIFRSFGEGKLPVYVYLTMPSVLIFGLNEFAVRFPSALFGSLSVLLIYFLVKKFSKDKLWPLLTALVLATMPWHIHFSRAAFEANVSLFLITLASLLFFQKRFISSIITFTLAIFTYSAALIFIPLWAIYLFFRDKQKIILLLFLPLLLLLFLQTGYSRFSGISIFNTQSGVMQRLEEKYRETRNQPLWLTRALHNKPMEFTWDIAKRYISHFDSDFLFFQGDPNRPRYRVPNTGQVLWICWPFLFLGLYFLAKKKHWLILVWLLLAPLPAAITFETPSAIRAILMILPLAATIALGVSVILKRFPWSS